MPSSRYSAAAALDLNMVLSLAVDCSFQNLTLLLRDGDAVLAKHNSGDAQASQDLLRAIDEVFGKAGRSRDELERILFAHGPGSFTSLRIGFATLYGLWGEDENLEWGVISSLKLRVLGSGKPVCFPARKQKVYLGWLENGEFKEACLDAGAFSAMNLPDALGPKISGSDPIEPEFFLKIPNNSISYDKSINNNINLNYLQPESDVATRANP